jgi:hypothetical protein
MLPFALFDQGFVGAICGAFVFRPLPVLLKHGVSRAFNFSLCCCCHDASSFTAVKIGPDLDR